MNEKINLFVNCQHAAANALPEEFEWMTGADALVFDPCHCDVDTFHQLPVDNAVICSVDPERDSRWQENDLNQWVCDDGLEQAARLRDRWQKLNWVPQLSVYRPQTRYGFSGPAPGEGFSFYMPDTSTIKGWRVTDGDMLLADAIARATALGFSALWLHSAEAETRARGLELEMLDKTRGGSLDIWISGGVSEQNHLHNLTKVGGASAVVVSEKLARETSVENLSHALLPEVPEPEEVPVQFVQCPSQVEKG